MNPLSNETLQTFKDLPKLCTEFLATIPEELLDRKRNESTWTIREHVYHIVDVQEMLLGRIITVKNEQNPVIKPFFPQNEEISTYTTIDEALSRYSSFRKQQYELVTSLSQAELEKTALHQEYDIYSIPILVRHMIFHENWHMYRMEEIAFTKDKYFE